MKRARIIEDWSRFNRAVLEIADGRAALGAPKPPPRREPTELVTEPSDGRDPYGLIARHKWRERA